MKIEGPLTIRVSAGQRVKLHASVTDVDGDKVAAKWYQTPVSGFTAKAIFNQNEGKTCELLIPTDAKSGEEIHVIVAGMDLTKAPLTTYQRVILRIK